MKLSKKMEKAFNEQIVKEMDSSHLYLSMAMCLEYAQFRGFAAWMKVQAKEETGHANRIIDYVIERGGKVTLGGLDKPKTDWPSPLAAFEDSLKHEEYISDSILSLVKLAESEGDVATGVFLQWFVTEQVEEESSVGEAVEKLKMVGESSHGLLMLDSIFGKRGE